MDAARMAGWMVAHFRPAKTQRGRWITPMAGDKGFPDLVLAKDGRVLLAELKTDKGTPSPEQVAWLAAVGTHGRLWRPDDWPAVLIDLGIAERPALSAEDRADLLRERTEDARDRYTEGEGA